MVDKKSHFKIKMSSFVTYTTNNTQYCSKLLIYQEPTQEPICSKDGITIVKILRHRAIGTIDFRVEIRVDLDLTDHPGEK